MDEDKNKGRKAFCSREQWCSGVREQALRVWRLRWSQLVQRFLFPKLFDIRMGSTLNRRYAWHLCSFLKKKINLLYYILYRWCSKSELWICFRTIWEYILNIWWVWRHSMAQWLLHVWFHVTSMDEGTISWISAIRTFVSELLCERRVHVYLWRLQRHR